MFAAEHIIYNQFFMKCLASSLANGVARLLAVLMLLISTQVTFAEFIWNDGFATDAELTDGNQIKYQIALDEDAGTAVLKGCELGSLVTELNIPATVKRASDGKVFLLTEIGDNAFEFHSELTSVTIPSAVTSIGMSAFSQCRGLTSIEIPDAVTYISLTAFSGCTGLTSVKLPASLISLSSDAFGSCTGLQSLEIDSANNSYASIEGVLYNKAATTLIICPAGKTGTLTIPSSVIEIGPNAFMSCSKLTDIEIPNSVTTIGHYAFQYCRGLTSIDIPESVTSLGHHAFSYCAGLTSLQIPNSVTSIGGYACEYCSGLTSVKLPNSLSAIAAYMFMGCENLASLEIPNPVKTIGREAFSGCKSLTSITIPAGVTKINISTFADCTRLVTINIPESVTEIGHTAFSGCKSLESFKSPQALEKIGSGLFDGCTGLKEVAFTTRILSNIYKGYKYDFESLGLNDCVNLEKVVLGDVETECEPVIELRKDTFKSPKIKSLTIGNIIKSVARYTFPELPELSELTIGKGLGFNDFRSSIVNGLPAIEKLHTLLPIPSGVLAAAPKLRSLTMPLPGPGSADAVGNFGELFGTSKSGNVTQYFEDGTTKTYSIPTTLEELTILEGCGMIPYGGLSNCNMLKKLTLPSTIYMVGEKALYGCAQLSDIYCMGAEPAVAYDNSFDGMRLTSCKLHVPYNSGDMYKEAEGWKRFRYIQEEAPIVISVTKNIENAGVVFGMDEYQAGQTAELRAVANSGYTFEGWYEGETLLTAEGTYAFTVLGNRELVAVFAPVADSNPVSVDAPGETATFMWPAVEDAASYTVTAYSDEAMTVPVVTVSLDASGNPIESRVNGDMSATLSGLSKETRYYYSISAFNANGGMLSRYTGAFTTGTAAIGEVSGDAASPVPAAYYNSQGIRSSAPWRGLNVVIYTDGSRRKLLID